MLFIISLFFKKNIIFASVWPPNLRNNVHFPLAQSVSLVFDEDHTMQIICGNIPSADHMSPLTCTLQKQRQKITDFVKKAHRIYFRWNLETKTSHACLTWYAKHMLKVLETGKKVLKSNLLSSKLQHSGKSPEIMLITAIFAQQILPVTIRRIKTKLAIQTCHLHWDQHLTVIVFMFHCQRIWWM